MPLKCTFRPNRSAPRRYRLRDVIRLACKGIDRGDWTRAELDAGIDECDDDPVRRSQREAELQRARAVGLEQLNALGAIELAATQLGNSNGELLSQREVLFDMLRILGILIAIGRAASIVARPVRLAVAGASALQTAVRARLERVSVQVAANQQAIQILRREAANNPLFRRAANQ